MNDKRTPIERMIRLGWEALDQARREPPTLDKIAQNARDAIETARRGIFDEASLKNYHFVVPLDNATSAATDFELSVGEASIYRQTDNPQHLVDASLTYLGSLSFGAVGDVQRQVFLRQSTQMTVGWVNPIHWTNRPHWDIGLSDKVPYDLRVQGGVGDADINLAGLQIDKLQVEGNIGSLNITLPTHKTHFDASIRGGAGPIALNIPENANGTIHLRGGVGGLIINIAPQAAAQIVLSGGVGRVVMEPGFNKTEAAAPVLPNTGTWETANFTQVHQRVMLHIAEGMVGSIQVRVLRDI